MKLFTKEELGAILVSVLALTLFYSYPDIRKLFFLTLPIVFLSFILRQTAHKMLARRLQCTATYKISSGAMLLSLLTMFLKPFYGFVTMVTGYLEIVPYKFGRWGIKVVKLTPYDLGAVCLAGIGVNLFLAYFFLFFSGNTFHIIVEINAFLALYSLIPIPPLDGSKVFMWSIWGWLFILLLSIVPLILL